MSRLTFLAILVLSNPWLESVFADDAQIEGIAQQALTRAEAELKREVDEKRIAGGAHMVASNGKVVHFAVAGVSDLDTQKPLRPDTIMRIYSMSKPITSVAAMTLWEQGKFKLDDPVSKHIATFEGIQVIDKGNDGAYTTVAAERPITVRDVFRHTAGISYGDGILKSRYEMEGMRYHGPEELFPPKMTIAQAAESLGRIPALHQPGVRFTYGFNTDLLGRLIEVWSDETLSEYMQHSVLLPLEMVDTGFSVPRSKWDRFSSCHAWQDDKQVVVDKASESPFLNGFKFLSGGGGLVSTMQDYANFCQMLVDGGTFKGKRILNKSTLKLMFTDQLRDVDGDFQFGLGFAIHDVGLASKETATAYSWGGYANTSFHVVPEKQLYQIFMRQSVPSNNRVSRKLFATVYEGIK